jgi:hypothetical protein
VPSTSKLSQLGLSSMDVVSDTEGLTVRGKFLSTGGIGSLAPVGVVGTPGLVGPPALAPGVGRFPVTATQSYIGGTSPRALGASAFAATGFGLLPVTGVVNGNPTFGAFTNIQATANVADVSGSGALSVQFWATSIGN